jgi:Mrp family chromosome partitioning ATPase
VAQIQEELKLPLMGRVREEAMGRAGPVANGRGAMEEADLESFRILRTNLGYLNVDKPLRSIAVTSPLADEGKSTVAISLAFANAWAGKRTLLVECDLRRPVLAERLKLQRAPGLTEFVAGTASPKEVLQPVALDPPSTNGHRRKRGGKKQEAKAESTPAEAAEASLLVCITAGSPPPRPAELLASQRFSEFIAEVANVYDVVILDTAPMLQVADTLELLPKVDGVVVCVRAARTTRDQARAARSALDHLPERPAGLVVTGVRPGDETEYGYYYSASH